MNGRGKIDVNPQLPLPPKQKRTGVGHLFAGLGYRTKGGGRCIIIDPDACDLTSLPEPAED